MIRVKRRSERHLVEFRRAKWPSAGSRQNRAGSLSCDFEFHGSNVQCWILTPLAIPLFLKPESPMIHQRYAAASRVRPRRTLTDKREASRWAVIASTVICLGAAGCAASYDGVDTIVEEDLHRHIAFLADDRLEGRLPGTEGCEEAARYIAQQFGRAGLRPGGDWGTYFQNFTVEVGRKINSATRLQVNEEKFALDEQFAVALGTGNSKGVGELVFVGFGIHAPELGHDDYETVDVAGKVVVAFTGAPGRAEETGLFLETSPHGKFARPRTKIETAYGKKAAGMILIHSPLDYGDAMFAEELPEFISDRGRGLSFAAVHLTASAAETVFSQAGWNLAEFDQKLHAGEVISQPMTGVNAEIEILVEPVEKSTANVVGYLQGKSDEVVVVGAHYDHLGLGGTGSRGGAGEIHNGADDNASGTAVLIELAEACHARPGGMKRTIVFVAFSAEELGLLGSAHYAEHPFLPMDQTVAMLNFDMVGRSKDGYCAVGAGESSREFEGIAERVNEDLKLGLNLEISDGGMSRGSSDHQSFLNREVPSLFFFAGLHDDYHKPSDDIDKINFAGTETISRLAFGVLARLDATTRPKFVAAAAPANPHGGSARSDDMPRSSRPWFGSVPSFGGDVDGVLFDGITEGSPAHAGGLQAGDILVEFAGQAVHTLEDFTVFLSAHDVGDTVDVAVLRDGQRVEAQITLALRP